MSTNRLDSMRATAQAQIRNDFMIGNGKANAKDNLTRQQIGYRMTITPQERNEWYAQNQFIQNGVDIPAEDMFRNGFEIVVNGDPELEAKLMRKIRDLDVKGNFTDMRRYERLQGDGFIAIGVTQPQLFTLAQPLPLKLKSVDYLNAFSTLKVGSFQVNEDMFSSRYGRVEFFSLNRMTSTASALTEGTGYQGSDSDVHYSRLIHDQTRRIEGEYYGQSILEPMRDILTIFDTAQWSVGQLLYNTSFKVYQSDGIATMTGPQRQEFQMLADFMFRTEATAIIGKEESLTTVGAQFSGIQALLEYTWELISGGWRMPKSVIKGQEAGTIAGAQYDVINYYSRIAAAQETEMRPHLEHLIRLIMMSDEFGGLDPETVDWELKFNPLWNVDNKTDAEIRKMNSETDANYIASGVMAPDEVRAERFPELEPTEFQMSTEVMSEEEMRSVVDAMDKAHGTRT